MMRGLVVGAVSVLLVTGGHPVGATVIGPPPSVCDFVTGGGFIVLADRTKANFGVGGGLKKGGPWGHLEYNARGTKAIQVHGTGVMEYGVPMSSTSAYSRMMKGTAEVNGMDGFTYVVTVTDKAEPGAGIDEFSIDVFDPSDQPYHRAGFAYGDGVLAGGNIQLHSPNPSTACP